MKEGEDMPKVYKRGKTWTAQVWLTTPSGETLRPSKSGFRTKDEAEAWVDETRVAHRKGVNVIGSNSAFRVIAEDWFENICKKKNAINTQYNTWSRLNTHINPAIGDIPVKKITNSMLQDFYNDLGGSHGLAPSSSKKVMATISSVLKYALKRGMIPFLPTEIEKLPIIKEKIRYWTEEQLKLFLDYIKDDEKLFIPVLTASMTGVRPAELFGIQIKKYDPDYKLLEISSQVIKDKISKELILSDILKTDSSYRTISLPFLVTDKLDEYILQLPYKGPNKFLFGDEKGNIQFYDNTRVMFKRRIMKIRSQQKKRFLSEETPEDEIEDKLLPIIKLYELRHTHATILLANGENIKVISERLGHSSIKMTLDTYASVMPKSRTKTASLLDDIFKK